MLNLSIFNGLFDSNTAAVITVSDFLLCLGCSLIVGVIIALSYMFKSRYTKSFVITLALLPAVVCVVIMMVNGNLGAGVAVAGAFSLIRFRSAPGTAKEIVAIFLAMGAGLIAGMGYLAYSILFAIILCAAFILLNCLNFDNKKLKLTCKTLNITIPEDLDYSKVFEDILLKYTSQYDLIKVKTTNMGSMFRLTYNVVLKDSSLEKEMVDEIRCRNGNLEITVSNQDTSNAEL